VIPPDANAAFVAAMEDVLETYQKPSDPERPLVCLDETSKQLVIETHKPIPAKPGRPARRDYEYERNGVANLWCAPIAIVSAVCGKPTSRWTRHGSVAERAAKVEVSITRRLSQQPLKFVVESRARHRTNRKMAATPGDCG